MKKTPIITTQMEKMQHGMQILHNKNAAPFDMNPES